MVVELSLAPDFKEQFLWSDSWAFSPAARCFLWRVFIQAKKPRRDRRGGPDRYGETRDLPARSARKEISFLQRRSFVKDCIKR
jgi:hypothetical protein